MKRSNKRYLAEIKEYRDNLVIERLITKNRLLVIFESEYNLINFKKLSKNKQRDISFAFCTELHRLGKNNLINEDIFSSLLQKFKGNSLPGVIEALFEPFIDKILTQLNISGPFKNFLISFLTTNPKKLIAAFRNCETMAELIAESIVEAIVMSIQKDMNVSGTGSNILRNIIGKTLKEQAFIQKLSDNLESYVCNLFNDLMKKNNSFSNITKKATGIEMPIG
jgi:hypothetical protein